MITTLLRLSYPGLPPVRPPIWEDSVHQIPMNEVSPDFAECWQAAARHLQQQGQGAHGDLQEEPTPAHGLLEVLKAFHVISATKRVIDDLPGKITSCEV